MYGKALGWGHSPLKPKLFSRAKASIAQAPQHTHTKSFTELQVQNVFWHTAKLFLQILSKFYIAPWHSRLFAKFATLQSVALKMQHKL
jgi:hypothetical protein